ncbi:MAG: hypothetical protein QOG34_588 [Frankiaceae bacterium]|nr:hypothetical protein [Frankiaceae bacterium]
MLVVALVLLAGCSGDPGQPRTLPHLTPTPTPTATKSVSDLEAATQVVRKYYALLNQLPTTMDASGIASLMASSCRCREQIAAINQAKSKGEHYVDHVSLISLTPVRDTSVRVSVLVEYNADRGGLVDAQGRVVSRSSPVKGVKRVFRLARDSDRWLIADIGTA